VLAIASRVQEMWLEERGSSLAAVLEAPGHLRFTGCLDSGRISSEISVSGFLRPEET